MTDQAEKYVKGIDGFLSVLKRDGVKQVGYKAGRRFDRILSEGKTKYFVDRSSWEIYGAKSSFQYNPRRWYGTLDSTEQYTWKGSPLPVAGTQAERIFNERESAIVQNYRKRGRPRKVVAAPGASTA